MAGKKGKGKKKDNKGIAKLKSEKELEEARRLAEEGRD
jgi:hypothetical protein